MISLRASSMPRVAACPASTVKPAVDIRIASPAADLGNGVHEVMAAHICGQEFDIPAIAAKWDLEPYELEKISWLAIASFKPLRPYFAGAKTEHTFKPFVDDATGIIVTGTGDVLSIVDRVAHIADHKTGFKDRRVVEQVMAYGLLAIKEFADVDRVKCYVVQSRTGLYDTFGWTREELEHWWEWLSQQTVNQQSRFSPSTEACEFCPRMFECPSRADLVKRSVSLISDFSEVQRGETRLQPGDIDPELVGMMIERARFLAKECEFTIGVARDCVRFAGGVLPVGNGREAAIETQHQREIVYEKAEQILQVELGMDRLKKILWVGKGDVEKSIGEVAKDKGAKVGAAKKEILEKLDDAGALQIKTVEKLVIRPATQLLSEAV